VRAWHMLRARLQSLLFRERREADLREELSLHLEREAERLRAAGLSPEDAHHQAQRVFGSVEAVKEACRDARGRRLLDALLRDVSYAFRSFRRTPLVALTIVATLGLGLGLVAAVFTILNAFVFRVDAVRNPHELFAFDRTEAAGSSATVTRADYDSLVRDTDVFVGVVAFGAEVDRWVDGRRLEGALVTGNFFHVLGAGALRGRTLAPPDDEPGSRQAIVLSHRAWVLHFASAPDVVGRRLLVNSVSAEIVGVMPEDFRGLTAAAPDFWAPIGLPGPALAQRDGPKPSDPVRIVGRLRPGVSRGQALGALVAWDRHRAAARSSDPSSARVTLEPRSGTVPLSGEVLAVFMPLFFAFGLVLVVGCANVANLLLARAVARQREIGIRLATGASRHRVVRQLLTESLVLALGAAALGLGISRLVLGGTVAAVLSTMPPDIGNVRLAVPPMDWRIVVFLIVGAVASTAVFALAPALQATRLDLVRAMRGEVIRQARPGRARQMLVGVQVTGAALLLICAAVFLRGAAASATADPGIRTSDVVMATIGNEQARVAMLDAVRSEPVVARVSATWPGDISGRAAFARGESGKSAVTYQFASPEYFDVLGIRIVRGRGFSDSERNPDAAVAIVSESVARRLWPNREAFGQVIHLEPDPASPAAQPHEPALVARSAVVVGVAGDVAGFRFIGMRAAGAGIYLPIDAAVPGTRLTMRVHGDPERARRVLVERLSAIDPDMEQVSTLRTMARMETYFLGVAFWLTAALGALALVLTLSGLFSVLSYLVEQRTRELGVRMALGASGKRIGALVLSQLARPVAAGLIVGASLTAALGAGLLATPAAAEISATIELFDPVAYAVSLLAIVAASACAALLPAHRAGRIEPFKALRHD
jgi:predicted permease